MSPQFSIVIPTYNRPVPLRSCLESFIHLDYPRDKFEVIVVDDGSVMDLQDVVLPFFKEFSIQFKKQKNSGPASARNTGAQMAKGDYLVFIDDDCQMAADYLRKVESNLTAHPEIPAIGGTTINVLLHNIYAQASQILVDYLYSYFNKEPYQAQFLTSNNMVVFSPIFHQLGGFDISFPNAAAEDREFCNRWLSRGHSIYFLKEAVIYHAHHLTFRKYWIQHFKYGAGAAHFHKVLAKEKREKISLEPFSFYSNLLCYPFRNNNGHQNPFLLSVLLLISQAATALGFFSGSPKAQHEN